MTQQLTDEQWVSQQMLKCTNGAQPEYPGIDVVMRFDNNIHGLRLRSLVEKHAPRDQIFHAMRLANVQFIPVDCNSPTNQG